MHRRRLIQFAAAAASAALLQPLRAQDKILRIVLPYGPGGITDVMTRMLTPSMSKTLNRTILIENKPGAAGLISVRAVQNQPTDGSLSYSAEIPGGAAAQPAVAGGTLYVVSGKGQLLAFR